MALKEAVNRQSGRDLARLGSEESRQRAEALRRKKSRYRRYEDNYEADGSDNDSVIITGLRKKAKPYDKDRGDSSSDDTNYPRGRRGRSYRQKDSKRSKKKPKGKKSKRARDPSPSDSSDSSDSELSILSSSSNLSESSSDANKESPKKTKRYRRRYRQRPYSRTSRDSFPTKSDSDSKKDGDRHLKPERVGFFNLYLSKEHGTSDSVVVGNKIYYRDVDIFIEAI